MLSQQIGNGFYLDDHSAYNQQVGEILTDNLLFVTDFQRDLVFNTQPPAAELNHQRFLINFFKKPITQNLIDLKYGASDLISNITAVRLTMQ